jgi:hypothetical protein
LIFLGVAVAAIPASATITYSYCTGGCSATGGSYSAWQSEFGTSGQTLSASNLFTFVSGGLSGTPAIYTDSATGTVFNGYNGSSQDSLTVSGTTLAQSTSGDGTSIEVILPANTYALALEIAGSQGMTPWIAFVSSTSQLTGANEQYQLAVSATPGFYGAVSNTPIASVFVWTTGAGTLSIQSFEIGQFASDPVPETSTFFTLGSGLIGISLWRRRRSRNSPDRTLHN